ncbi:MAG: AtpZ/AtpI family protein [Bacteroidetes bacterium]|nr:AtpZ/AtpI family protein [Bacteroidota bacterium]
MADLRKEGESARTDGKRPTPQTSILRFAGMGVQLAVAIGLGVVAGMKVDEHFQWEHPLGTALFGLLGLAAGMYQVLRALLS